MTSLNQFLADQYRYSVPAPGELEQAVRNQLTANFEQALIEEGGYNPRDFVAVPRALWNRVCEQWAIDRAELYDLKRLAVVKTDANADPRDTEHAYYCPVETCSRHHRPFTRKQDRTNHAKTHGKEVNL